MEKPKTTVNQISTRIFQRDVFSRVSSNFAKDEDQTKTQATTLSQEMKNLRSELQEHWVIAVGGNST